MTTSASDFLDLAEREASRYAGESLVFLRELLQNARDAGAVRVSIETRVEQGVESISVTDDGRGMLMDHAQRFLLTLYASSKKRNAGSAGKFGVGFWSILRFDPSEITIASRSAEAENGWEIVFDSGLEIQGHRRCPMPVGTIVRMKRPARKGDLGSSAWNMVRRDARHLRMKDDPLTLIDVTVNGRRATEPIVAGRPGLIFRRRGLLGAITLGSVPEVVLLAHGLMIRSAATVDDLVLRPSRLRQPSKGGPSSGLSPRVVIDSDRLAVLMDRGDVAQDRALVSVVRVIRSETRRLCRMELDRLAPRSWWRRLGDVPVGPRVAGIVAVLVVVAVVFGVGVAVNTVEEPLRAPSSSPAVTAPSTRKPYIDRSSAYGGPVTSGIDGVGGAPDLGYRPVDQTPFLAAFRIEGIDEAGRPLRSGGLLRPAELPVYPLDLSLEIELRFQATGPVLRLPVPTGHHVISTSVALDGYQVGLYLTGSGEPAIRLDGETSGRVTYKTAERPSERWAASRWPALPPPVARMAEALKSIPPLQRIEAAITLVRTSLAEEGAREGGDPADGFFGPVFSAGGGDCDVVNSVLAAVLSEAGLGTRLAVGWIGQGGEPMPGLHAWVEVDLGWGRVVPADASVPIRTVPPADPRVLVQETRSRHQDDLDNDLGWLPWWLGLPAGVALCLGLWGVHRVLGGSRRFNSAPDFDPGPLVESLVRDREAWPGFTGAWRRPLVPAHGVDRQSLAGVESAASRSALFIAKSPGEWVVTVKEGGGLVLDGSTRAGRAAAVTFGAFDLDQWALLWRRSRVESFGSGVQEALLRTGLNLEIRLVDGVQGGSGLALVLDGGERTWAVIDGTSPEWRRCRDLAGVRPAEAVFRGADFVVESLTRSGRRAQQALAELAQSVLREMDVDDGGAR